MMKVESVEHLKQLASGEDGEGFFILLNGGLKSSKRICWDEESKSWCITNFIDDSHIDINENELAEQTNIVKAIEKGAFYVE